MNNERSKSELHIHPQRKALNIDSRVKSFISRQLERENTSETLSLHSTLILNPKTESSAALTTTTLKSSKRNLKDLKKIQETLRFQLHSQGSYSACSVLKKVVKKCEEVEHNVKVIENKSKELKNLEKNIENKLSEISSMTDMSKTMKFKSLNSTFSTLQVTNSNPELDLIKRKIIFEEGEYEKEEIGTPEFLSTKSVTFQTNPKLSSTIKTDPKFLNHKDFFILKPSANPISPEKLEKKEKNLKKFEKFLICSSIIHSIISEAQDLIITKEKMSLEILQEKLKSELHDISTYQTTILSHHSQRNQELDCKEKELHSKESKILYQLKLLSQEKSEKLIQYKIEELERKEAKLRQKQLSLLELKEFLIDKEEELVQKEAFLRVRYSSVYKEIDEGRMRVSDDSWNEQYWKRESEIEELYKSVCERDSDIVATALGLQSVNKFDRKLD